MASQHPQTIEPTVPELQEAFRESRLWVQGYTFRQAMSLPLLKKALVMQARARFDHLAAARPVQHRLI